MGKILVFLLLFLGREVNSIGVEGEKGAGGGWEVGAEPPELIPHPAAFPGPRR